MRSSLKILSATLLCAIQVMSDQKIEALYDGLLDGQGNIDEFVSWMDNFASDMEYCTKSTQSNSNEKCVNKNTFEEIIQNQYFGESWNLVDNQYAIIQNTGNYLYEINVDFTYETTTQGCTVFESRTDSIEYSSYGKGKKRTTYGQKITSYTITNQKFDETCAKSNSKKGQQQQIQQQTQQKIPQQQTKTKTLPTKKPTQNPTTTTTTAWPTQEPTPVPTNYPTKNPTTPSPTDNPTPAPTKGPTDWPTKTPTDNKQTKKGPQQQIPQQQIQQQQTQQQIPQQQMPRQLMPCVRCHSPRPH